MADESTESGGTCILCARRDPRDPPACDLCRQRLAARLWELRDLHALLPAALNPGRGDLLRVSGSREEPLPLRVGALDYAAPARIGAVTDQVVPMVRTWHDPDEPLDGDSFYFAGWRRELVRGEDGAPLWTAAHDQDGAPSVAAVLDTWARDWAETLGLPLPMAEVPALVSWLSRHLYWAIQEHPAIQEFAEEVTTTLYAVRALLNVSRAVIHLAEACPSCTLTALQRDPGGGDIECGNCRATWPLDDEEEAA